VSAGEVVRSTVTRSMSVTVVICTLDRAALLPRTIDALVAQDHTPLEVVVVNGPSHDHTELVLDRYRSIVRTMDCAEASLGRSRNIGLSAAAGDIVAFIDDDAVPPPDWVTLLTGAYTSDRVGGVGGPVFDVPLQRVEWRVCTSTRLGLVATDAEAADPGLSRPGADPFVYLAGCNMSFRREVLREVGGFNPLLSYGYDDVDVCRAVIDAGYEIHHEPRAVVEHDRAPSAIRDGHQVLHDPYPIIASRGVFALQCPGLHGHDDVARALSEWSVGWQHVAAAQHAEDILSDEEVELFAARASQAVADTIVLPRAGRPFVDIPAPDPTAFKPLLPGIPA
jgi:GT2 family glycosyltransferase